ncbi:MAG: Nudix family hydrolase [Marinobacter sp.]|nr:Nudix family hydrolase [Marinobacter sp.]
MSVKHVHVAVGVVWRQGRVLIARRPDHLHQGGLLEFPGGKVEAGESVQQALVRELLEETGVQVALEQLQPLIQVRHDYGDKQVLLDVWQTASSKGEPVGHEGQPVFWLAPEALEDAQFPAANRAIIRALRLSDHLAITGAFSDREALLARVNRLIAERRPAQLLFRAPWLSPQAYKDCAAQLLEVCRLADTKLLLHGDPAPLLVLPAAGIHLPWRVASALSGRPANLAGWLGVSCHSQQELEQAVALGADYVTLGPVAPTASHPGAAPMGWQAFRALAVTAPVPVYALGGLGPADIATARRQGAQGVAGIRGWWPEI